MPLPHAHSCLGMKLQQIIWQYKHEPFKCLKYPDYNSIKSVSLYLGTLVLTGTKMTLNLISFSDRIS